MKPLTALLWDLGTAHLVSATGAPETAGSIDTTTNNNNDTNNNNNTNKSQVCMKEDGKSKPPSHWLPEDALRDKLFFLSFDLSFISFLFPRWLHECRLHEAILIMFVRFMGVGETRLIMVDIAYLLVRLAVGSQQVWDESNRSLWMWAWRIAWLLQVPFWFAVVHSRSVVL
ncbi:unnamed protein product, partial [Polarella glacialis]